MAVGVCGVPEARARDLCVKAVRLSASSENLKAASHLLRSIVWIVASSVCLGQAHAGQGILPPVIPATDHNGVDVVSGTLTAPSLQLSIGSSGSGLNRSYAGFNQFFDNFTGVINRVYNLGNANPPTWTGVVNLSVGGVSEQWSMWNGTIAPILQPTANTLTCDATSCTFTMADGAVAVFNKTPDYWLQGGVQADYAELSQITRPDGEVLNFYFKKTQTTAFIPDATTIVIRGQRMVTSSLGWAVKYQLGSGAQDVMPSKVTLLNTSIAVCDVNADSCSAADDAQWPFLLAGWGTNGGQAFPDANGLPVESISSINSGSPPYTSHVSSYTSLVGGNVSATLFPENHSYLDWDNDFKVHTLTRNGHTWTYAYSPWQNGVSTTTVTDPNSHTQVYTFRCAYFFCINPGQGTGQVLSAQDELGRVTRFVWSGSKVTQVISPEATYSGSTLTGGYTQYAYDARGNLTSVSVYPKGGGAPLVTTAIYPETCSNPKTCNKPISVTDANGNTTAYTYDPTHGGVTSETKPTVNGVQAQTRYAYSQITPYALNTSGVLVAQPPVWRLTLTSTCRTMTLATCVRTVDEMKTTVSYGSDNTHPTYNNVLPVSQTVSAGDGSVSSTTSFTYDNSGRVTVVDGPRTDVDDRTYTTYDRYGHALFQIGPDPDGAGPLKRVATRTSYDPEGRVLQVNQGVTTATDGSDFIASNFTRNTYDTSTGRLIKTEVGQP